MRSWEFVSRFSESGGWTLRKESENLLGKLIDIAVVPHN